MTKKQKLKALDKLMDALNKRKKLAKTLFLCDIVRDSYLHYILTEKEKVWLLEAIRKYKPKRVKISNWTTSPAYWNWRSYKPRVKFINMLITEVKKGKI